MIRGTIRFLSSISVAVRQGPASKIASRKAIVLTPTALAKVKKILTNDPTAKGLRINIRTRGCNGLAYVMDYTYKLEKLDEIVMQDGVTICIAPKALMSIIGTEMDYSTNLLNSGFVFNNPNIQGTCGCGESFRI